MHVYLNAQPMRCLIPSSLSWINLVTTCGITKGQYACLSELLVSKLPLQPTSLQMKQRDYQFNKLDLEDRVL